MTSWPCVGQRAMARTLSWTKATHFMARTPQRLEEGMGGGFCHPSQKAHMSDLKTPHVLLNIPLIVPLGTMLSTQRSRKDTKMETMGKVCFLFPLSLRDCLGFGPAGESLLAAPLTQPR